MGNPQMCEGQRCARCRAELLDCVNDCPLVNHLEHTLASGFRQITELRNIGIAMCARETSLWREGRAGQQLASCVRTRSQ
jgi:hypothetical protein